MGEIKYYLTTYSESGYIKHSDQEIDDLRFCIMAVDESDCLVLVDYTDDGTSATLWAASVAGTEMTAAEAQAWGATVVSGFDINDYKIIRI